MSEYITMRDCLKIDLSNAIAQRDEARHLAESAMLEADRLRSQLWRARDRAWKLAYQRSYWRLDCLEQCKLLAMSADREEKLLQQAAALRSQISNLKSP